MDVSSCCLALLLVAGSGPADADAVSAVAESAVAIPPAERIALSELGLSKVRVRTPSGSYVLRQPRFVAEGIAWRSADGFPRGPRPLLAPGWDTVPPPPNPMPWSRVDLIERSVAGSRRGTVIGASTGAVLGGTGGAFLGWAAAMADGGSVAGVIATSAIGALTGGILVGLVGRALFDPPDRWEAVSPPMRP